MVSYLLLASLILFICIFFNKISSKIGLPILFSFIILGMLFGVDGIFKIKFDNYEFTEQIASFALIIIMFYGGFGTKWKEAKPVATQAILLSSFGTIITAFLVGIFCHFCLKIKPVESLLIGSVICSTDAASVFAILRAKKLNFKYNTASLLELESGSNDPFSYMLTIVCITLMNQDITAKTILVLLTKQLFFGLLFGLLVAVIALYIFNKTKLVSNGFESIFMVACALLSYSISQYFGGNGFLSTYLAGIIIGNSIDSRRQQLVHFFDSTTNLMQIILFFFLGLLSTPSKIPPVIIPGVLITLFLTFIARPLAVFLLLTPFKSHLRQQLIVAWSGLRGAASIAFAILIILNKVNAENDIFHIIFVIVLCSIFFQGSLIPFFSKKLKMIDKDFDVMRTFNDYTEEVPITYISTTVTAYHPWANQLIKDIVLPPQTLILMIVRNKEKLIAKGNTELLENDIIILSGNTVSNSLDINLYEKNLKKNDSWVGKYIKDIDSKDELIVIIKRNDKLIIPKGNIMFKEKDTVVICNSDSLS
ncbi:MAG: potassium/proton antiporter [Spirochaetales bacterium]|nr:potassium/proton antiporter [Spirochaetales bacterium]